MTSAGGVKVRRSVAVRRDARRRTGPAARRRSGPGPGAACPGRRRRATARGSPGSARATPLDDAHDRLAERQRDHQRREGERAAQQRVVEHGHLDDHAAQALGGRASATSSVVLAPSEVPATTAWSTPSGRAGAMTCSPKSGHRVAPHVARAVGLPWPRRSSVMTRLPRSARSRASGMCIRWESSRPWIRTRCGPLAVLGVGEAVTLVDERRHLLERNG